MTTARRSLPDWFVTTLWTLAAIFVLDQAVGFAVRVPADPLVPPGVVPMYFDAGRSIEAKLRYAVAADDTLAAPVMLAGWLDTAKWPAEKPLAPGQRRLSVYGPSFALAAGESLASIDPVWAFRSRGGPASPLPHAYALWSVDRRRVHSDVAVLGILASSLRASGAMTGATWMFESPYPYTYPRYRSQGDSLSAVWPSVRSCDQLRATLRNPAALAAWERELAANDEWYRPVLFRAGWMDHSLFVRLVRRAWGQRVNRGMLARVHTPKGFREDSEALRTGRELALRFAREVRADGGLPVVLLVADRGYDDHLWKAFGPLLERSGVPCVSTHDLAPPGDAASFTADAHFTGPLNVRIAQAIDEAIRQGGGEVKTSPDSLPAEIAH